MASFQSASVNESPGDCMLSYVRALCRPPVFPPTSSELFSAMLALWDVRIPVNTDDSSRNMHWREQQHTEMLDHMFSWNIASDMPRAKLHPYFSFGIQTGNPFFNPSRDVAECLKHLLLHIIGFNEHDSRVELVSHDVVVFIATDSLSLEKYVTSLRIDKNYYMIRCHYEKRSQNLIFGYHCHGNAVFQQLHVLALSDPNWRLKACLIIKNIAKIIHALIAFAVPLACNDKLSVVGSNIQKIYWSDDCGIKVAERSTATVSNMIVMYQAIEDVPHTDKLVSVQYKNTNDGGKTCIVCQFSPIGRSYLPENLVELLDALVCVAEALSAIHSRGIMHRDIRWANVFHAFSDASCAAGSYEFTREWFLFDFEFAAISPQPAFAAHTLTPGNHAPEMTDSSASSHTTAVDIWGLGYLIHHANVDVPVSHAALLADLKDRCLQGDPLMRPSADDCLRTLLSLQDLPQSHEKDINWTL